MVGVKLVGAVLPELETGVVEVGAAGTGEEHAADAAENPNGRQHRLDQGEAQLGIGVEHVVADELQVLIAAQIGVATEVVERRLVAPALEAAAAQRQQAGAP